MTHDELKESDTEMAINCSLSKKNPSALKKKKGKKKKQYKKPSKEKKKLQIRKISVFL